MNSYATAEVEHQKLQEASKHLDKNKDGMVTTEELLNPSTLKSGGVRDCEKVKEKLDWKYRRGLTFADFYDMITSARLSACDVENAFNYIDADHNGKINLAELRTTCEEVIKEKSPGSIPDVKVNEVFKKVDINNDGYIDIEEFRNTLKSD